MRSEHPWSHPLEYLHRYWHPNSFFALNSLSLLASFLMFCWICGAIGNLLRTYTVCYFDWLNLLLAYIWAPLAILSVTWLALFRWELLYVLRSLSRPFGIGLLVGCELLCGWIGWLCPPSFTPLPLIMSIPFALIGFCVDCYLLTLFICLAWDRLRGPHSWNWEQNQTDEGWKSVLHPSPFLRWYYSLLHQWYTLRQMVREDAKRERPMNEQE